VPLVYRASTGTLAFTWPPPLARTTTSALLEPPATLAPRPLWPCSVLWYHMADYFIHWLQFGRSVRRPPRDFSVNWFRKDADGKFMWPGYGENMRVLSGLSARAGESRQRWNRPSAGCRRYQDMDWDGLEMSREKFNELTSSTATSGKNELVAHEELFVKLYDRLPKELFCNMRQC